MVVNNAQSQGGVEIMLTMTQIKDIRRMNVEEGKNVSEMARENGYDRNTVRKYLNKEDWNRNLTKVKKVPTFCKA